MLLVGLLFAIKDLNRRDSMVKSSESTFSIKSKRAVLVLEDGSLFTGYGFGALSKETSGECVFATGMTGYTETLTDPSYNGQILCLTYPLVGNYGVAPYSTVDEFGLPIHFESLGIKVKGLIIHELCHNPHHWASAKSLDQWLTEEGIPGIYGIDTRLFTRKLRKRGVMLGILKTYEHSEQVDFDTLIEAAQKVPDPNKRNLAAEVSTSEPIVYNPSAQKRVVLIDVGSKLGIVQCLLQLGVSVIQVPWNTPFEKIWSYQPDGVLISNGPGDPSIMTETIKTVRHVVDEEIPTFGICFGNQLLALALGASTFKLKYGHRGVNKPVIDLETKKCYITTQNHGFAVDPDSLEGTGLKLWFINADDRTVEGLKHETLPVCSFQAHPEAKPGPYDAKWLFQRFIKMMEVKS